MAGQEIARPTRRRLLVAGAAATSLFLPLPYARVWAQSDGALKLIRTPKQALVIGNGMYRNAPLRNPINDARGMAAALKAVGFGVELALESTQAAMREAIRAFSGNLARSKAVGLFYFAGHGAQLAWRNYLLPVDAEILDANELRERAVDLNSLIEGIRKAGNPMNVIILDACRDNPFGAAARVDQRGLSQLDAPPGTLLAYATSPGNTAIDGDGGENGLYTEHLLREIKVPATKVEDMFKRVRLGVRRRSNGQQIPWESTSLEDDFYFLPPPELRKRSDAEAAREFELELALWEKVKAANEPASLEDYLRLYPGGHFSEVAQLHLDRVLEAQGEKKIEIAPQVDNPFTKGSAVANTRYKVGDSYTYQSIDTFTRLLSPPRTETITQVTGTEVIYDGGRRITNLTGSSVKLPDGRRYADRQDFPAEYSVGKQWISRFHAPSGPAWKEYRIVAREKITVPAGTFNAFRIEGRGWSDRLLATTDWVDPDRVKRPIAREAFAQARTGNISRANRRELVAYKES